MGNELVALAHDIRAVLVFKAVLGVLVTIVSIGLAALLWYFEKHLTWRGVTVVTAIALAAAVMVFGVFAPSGTKGNLAWFLYWGSVFTIISMGIILVVISLVLRSFRKNEKKGL